MIGDVLLECELVPGQPRSVAGFENHAGRTYLDEGAEPLGRVLAGFGNDGASGYEGCRAGPRDRHLPPRATAPPQPVAGRLAAGAGARAPYGRAAASSSRSRTSSRPRPTPSPPIEREAGEAETGDRSSGADRTCEGSGGPKGAEVDRGVAGRPALEEAVDRRVQDDVVQLVGAEESVTADGHVLRGDRFERALAQVAREDDVDDVLGGEAARPARSSRRSRPAPRPAPRRRFPPPPAARGGGRPRGFRPSRRRRPGAASTRGRPSRAGRAGCSPASAGSRRPGCEAPIMLSTSRSRGRRARSPGAPRPRRARARAPEARRAGRSASRARRRSGSRASVLSRTTRISPR